MIGKKIKSFLTLILIVFIGPQSLIGFTNSTSDKKLQEYLNDIKVKKEAFAQVTDQTPKTDAPIVVHFIWASWCEYCEKAYLSLKELKENPEANGKIQILGYCLDEEINLAVKDKLKAMPAIEHFHVVRSKIKAPSEMNRLPAVLVENKKTKELTAYTGYTNERFRYMKKFILRSLSDQTGDVNED